MTKGNPYYFGLGYYESIESKKNLLSLEMSLLNIIKVMRKYYELRAKELIIKSEMQKAMKELDITINKTRSFLPFLKNSQKEKKEELVNKDAAFTIKKKFDADLEAQVREIQERLKAIEG